jgi:glutathione S-transferase
MKKIVVPKAGWAVVPVIIDDDGTCVQDTSLIIDYLEATYKGAISTLVPDELMQRLTRQAMPVRPSGAKQRIVSQLFEIYGDEWLKLPAMHYRWSFPEQLDFLNHEWGRAMNPSGTLGGSAAQHTTIKEQMAKSMSVMSGALPFLGVTGMEKQIEQSYCKFLDLFEAHLAHYPYLLGYRPCLGELALHARPHPHPHTHTHTQHTQILRAGDYGLMGPLYAHLCRDPVPQGMMKKRAPRVAEWVDRMNRSVEWPGMLDGHSAACVQWCCVQWCCDADITCMA